MAEVLRIYEGPVQHGEPLGYLTDDRDFGTERQRVLWISFGNNGDWYVSSTLPGDRPFYGTRLCTSGGAVSRLPNLVRGIADAYRALHTQAVADFDHTLAMNADRSE